MGRGVLWLSALLALGCSDVIGGGKDAKIPGEPLGTFHVIGHLETSSCGPGALGSTDLWEFDVRLSRDGHDLYWLNGAEAIPGRIAADGVSFAFDTRVAVEAIAAGKGQPGCAIVRSDTANGSLSSASTDVAAFSGRMRFGYMPSAGSDCGALVGVDGGFSSLPCEMSYLVDAVRTAPPE
jgi:hypothetical protein